MPLVRDVRGLVDSFSELVSRHLALARVELAQDARFIGLRVGVIAALAPLVLVGYGFLCVALALLLRRVMAPDLAFLIVGLVNLVPGLAGIVIAARQLGSKTVMAETTTELELTTALVRRETQP